ncbi:MAG: class I SAM-dependent methyltransferase [Phycisphaerae bacterium]
MSDRNSSLRPLTEQGFWDSVSSKRLDTDTPPKATTRRLTPWLRSLFADHTMAMAERVCARYLPRDPSRKMLEVGCAPGGILARFNSLLGYQPYGLEYAPAGVEETRRTFQRHGFDPSHVIEADLFDPRTATEHGEKYDLVMSFGLIEHFSDPAEVIRRHVDLVRPGGYLVIQIPKLTGICLLTMWLFRREFIGQHNRTIMHSRHFEQLFNGLSVERLYCGHVGFLKFYGLFSRRERTVRGLAARVCDRAQSGLNAVMRVGFAGRNLTWPWSPALLYIGRKPASPR